MDNPFSVVGDTVGEVLVGTVLGIAVSAIYAVLITLFPSSTPGWIRLLFVSIFALADIASILATAGEGFTAPACYVLARIGGYLFAIWILLQGNLPMTSALINLLILLGAFVLRLNYE
ncbi:hypothetical protein [Thermococcus sp.]|uniref:hypothetical protein n=1 Tax=Thermococcus sp. TaxID=35749 RepID=UPI0025DA4372|nr:hypothetical protein [Thermococcus sp.]